MLEEEFEEKIAYFYAVPHPQSVKEAYLSALKAIEEQGSPSALPYLEKAYQSIANQRQWIFDTRLAAEIELKIILGNRNGSSFEEIKDLMVQLYALVFQSDSPKIQNAAILRTFLYQYKAGMQPDRDLMLKIAKTSEDYLNSIELSENVLKKS